MQTQSNEKKSSLTHGDSHNASLIIQGNTSINNTFAIKPKIGSNIHGDVETHVKLSKKGFDPSAITSKINQAVSRAALSRRFSSNNSPIETPNSERISSITDSDGRSVNSSSSSIASGLTNMFQPKKPSVIKSFSKHHEHTQLMEHVGVEEGSFQHRMCDANSQHLFQRKSDETPAVSSSKISLNSSSEI